MYKIFLTIMLLIISSTAFADCKGFLAQVTKSKTLYSREEIKAFITDTMYNIDIKNINGVFLITYDTNICIE